MPTQHQSTAPTPRRQVLVTEWTCQACGMRGTIIPPLDLEGSEYTVGDVCSDIRRDHFKRTPKGEFHGALLTVER